MPEEMITVGLASNRSEIIWFWTLETKKKKLYLFLLDFENLPEVVVLVTKLQRSAVSTYFKIFLI